MFNPNMMEPTNNGNDSDFSITLSPKRKDAIDVMSQNSPQKKRKSCEIAKIVEQILDDTDNRLGRSSKNTFTNFGTMVGNNLNFLPIDRAYVLQFKINELISNEMNQYIAKQTGIEDLLLPNKSSEVPSSPSTYSHTHPISSDELDHLKAKVNRNGIDIDTLKEQMNTLVEALSNQSHEINLHGIQAQLEHTVINGHIIPQSIVESAILSHPNSNELGFKYLCDSVVGKEYWTGMTMGSMSPEDRVLIHGLIDLYVKSAVIRKMGTNDLSSSEAKLLLETLKTRIFASFKKRLNNLKLRIKMKKTVAEPKLFMNATLETSSSTKYLELTN